MNDESDIPAEPRRSSLVENPFGTGIMVGRPAGALAQSDQQKSVAEVQARMIIARANPRDPIRAMDLILQDCTRATLAQKALYEYARGGTAISGPSIRLVEAIAQRWGNIQSGVKEISRAGGYSECVAYAWDLQSSYYDEKQFQIRHWRDTKQGGYQLTDERDIYELISNMGQRRKRAAMLAVIPGDVVEAAVTQCEETLSATADTSPDAMIRMVEAFEQFNVTREQIERRAQRRIDAIRPAQVIQFSKIFQSLADGMSKPADWFDGEPGAAAGGVWGQVDAMHNEEQKKAAAAGGTTTQRRAPRKSAAKEPAEDEKQRDTGATAGGREEQGSEATSAPTSGGRAGDLGAESPAANQGTSNSAESPETGAAVGTSAPAKPSTAAGAAFSFFLIDADGIAIDGTDEFTDPLAFATAYARAFADMFPPERRGFERVNAEALAAAHALDPVGVEAALQPPAPREEAPKQQATGKDPELALDAPHDEAVIPKPAKPTRQMYIAYNNTLKDMLSRAATLEAVAHVATVNAESINAMANVYRLEAVGLIEARRKELAPPPAGKPAGTGSIVDDLLHDVYSLTAPESITTWLNMDATKQNMTPLKTSDPVGWNRVMAAANYSYVKKRVEQCKTAAEANEIASDKMVDGCLEWLFENAAKEHDDVVAFSKKFAEGLK